MQLEDRHLLYPETLGPQEVCDRIAACLAAQPANQAVWADERMDWQNFIQRYCWEMGVHPIWPLVSLQRERSLFTVEGGAHDFDFAQGVVGQDAPGTVNKRWNGLPTQVLLSIRSAAWLGNIGAGFGYRPGLRPSAKRWGSVPFVNSKAVELRDAVSHKVVKIHICQSMAEYVQLQFTPHLEVLDTNGNIGDDRGIIKFFE